MTYKLLLPECKARTIEPYTKMATRLENIGQGDQKHPSDLHLKTFRLPTRTPK